ncbi:MAG: 3'(2'),5'-bisphosphate nucleotidase CysQ [Alphaproteobacteria bacterium]|nr:MAG: 3'(2'),5'-bisphosphate nucleotidase CysQ [Alphaproteobacteria bacterium]
MFQTAVRNWTKQGGSPVSDADIAVDNFLRQRLTAIAPDCGWLSEETEDDLARVHAPRIWVVDPIDGTRAYLSGRTDWSISVALVENGRPVIGAIFAPMQDACYLAVAGEGTTLNGAAVAASGGASLDGIHAAGPKPMLERLAKVAPNLVLEPKVFSLALRIARVAAGTLDLSFASHNSHDWDLAAADLLVHEAGGALTTFAGQQLIYNRAEPLHATLVAAGRARHEAFLALVRAKTLAFA